MSPSHWCGGGHNTWLSTCSPQCGSNPEGIRGWMSKWLDRGWHFLPLSLDDYLDTCQTPKYENCYKCNKIWAATWQIQQNDLFAQRRLRSAWAITQCDQSLCCPQEETMGPWLSLEGTAKTLIRLGGCPGWSESSLGPQVISLVLSCGNS